MNDHRDPVVADALRRLDVPDHDPAFWDDLEARLGVTAPAGASERRDVAAFPDEADDAHVVDLATAGRGPGRPGHAPRWQLVAAVLVIVALLVGVNLLRSPDEEGSVVDVADEPGDGREPAPSDGDASPQTPADERSAALADEWLAALAAGDVETAYGLLAPAAREALSLDEFRGVSAGLAEGAGAFTAAGVERSTFTIDRAEGPLVTVVVYSGEVEREGMTDTASFPVVVTAPTDAEAGGVAFSLDPLIEPVPVTPAGQTLTSPLEVSVSSTAQAWVSIDGGPARPLAVGTGATDQVRIDVEALAGPGTHTVLLVAAEDGVATARSATVVVP